MRRRENSRPQATAAGEPPKGEAVLEHLFVVVSMGPWDPNLVRPYVSAHCSCGRWMIAYSVEDLKREDAADAWPLAQAILMDDHTRHARGAIDLQRRATLDDSWY